MARLCSLFFLLFIFSVSHAQTPTWNTESLRQYWLTHGTDIHEGIYENVQSDIGSPKYTVALKHSSADTYQLIYLSGAAPEDADRWSEGDVKAHLSKGKSANTYKVKWYMGDKTKRSDLTIVFEEGKMFVNWNSRPPVLYERIFPEHQIIISTNSTGTVTSESTINEPAISGFLVSATGILIAPGNALDAAEKITVVQPLSGKKFPATLLARDTDHNLALLQITDTTAFTRDTLPYNFGRTPAVGDNIFCLAPVTMDSGITRDAVLYNAVIVASTGKSYTASRAMQQACGGCPVFDRQGNLTGVLSAMPQGNNPMVVPVEIILGFMEKNHLPLAQKVLSDVNLQTQKKQAELLFPLVFRIETSEPE